MKYKKTGPIAGAIYVIVIIVFAVGLLSNPISLASDLVKEEQVNVLIMCSTEDSNIPDTVILLECNDEIKGINISFLPRNVGILDDKNSGVAKVKLSSYASENPPKEVTKRLGEMLGIEIHNYIKLDTGHFRNIVDALGGVEFNVPIKMYYEDPCQNLTINLEKGMQLLDGEKAEMLVRYRMGYPKGDIDRIEMQKAFLGAMIEQNFDVRIGSVKKLYQLLSKRMETNLSIGKAKKLINWFHAGKNITFVDFPVIQDPDEPFAPFLLLPKAQEIKEKF